jgi:hypothetical protein
MRLTDVDWEESCLGDDTKRLIVEASRLNVEAKHLTVEAPSLIVEPNRLQRMVWAQSPASSRLPTQFQKSS